MSLTPFQARLALLSFMAVGSMAAANILYFQDQALVSSIARSKSERAKSRAEAERTRRLALDPKDAQPVRTATPAKNERSPVKEPAIADHGPVTARIGRFAPTSGQLDASATPIAATATVATVAEPELRLPDIVRGIQSGLGQKGYEPGTPDGVVGLVTRAAIMAYEHDSGLPLTGEPSEPLLRHINGIPSSLGTTANRHRPARAPSAEHVIRSVQQSLSQLGYFAAKIDGRGNEETTRAIREYEMDSGLVPTGRVSAPLLVKLARSIGAPRQAAR